MGSKRVGQVRFMAIPGDHAGSAVPHLHAFIGSGQVVIELLAGNRVGLSTAHALPTRGKVTKNEVRIVLATAHAAFDDLLALWEEAQP